MKNYSDIIQESIQALADRGFYAAFPEHPKAYDENGDAEGRSAFKSQLNKPFTGVGDNEAQQIANENDTMIEEVKFLSQQKDQ